MTKLDARHWQGELSLAFAHQDTATRLIQERVKAPLKVQRPFYPEGEGVCHGVMLHTAGGIAGGDRLTTTIELQPQSQVLLTTAAATKVYRAKGGNPDLEAQQTVQIRIEPGACLEWLPQETIVFDQALYRQTLRVELAPGAHWLGWEITRLGRTARGEKFLAGDWRSRSEIWQGEQPLWIDRQWLPGSPETYDSPHGLAGKPVVASFVFLGSAVSSDLVELARHLWQNGHGEGDIGVTRLPLGMLCRYRGAASTTARQWFTTVWQAVRQQHLGRSLCIPRVWQ
jgi:urease accessory protein